MTRWRLSCAINAALMGDATEPLCSRVYRQPPSLWRSGYLLMMDRVFAERNHCCRVYRQWVETHAA